MRRITPPDEMTRTPEGVTEAYCMLQGVVNERVFGFSHASDCFCPSNVSENALTFWSSDPEVYQFIVDAVEEKIARRPMFQVTSSTVVTAVDREHAERQYERMIDADMVSYTIEELK